MKVVVAGLLEDFAVKTTWYIKSCSEGVNDQTKPLYKYFVAYL
jgi:hypothetical protein